MKRWIYATLRLEIYHGHDLPAALKEFKHRYGCRICIMPEGLLTIPALVA